MSTVRVGPPPGGLRATITVPGDKSIAHRALLLGALAEGTTAVSGFPGGADVLATLGAVAALGAHVERTGDVVRLEGRGARLGEGVEASVDCANSGTTMRLTAGLAAGGTGRITLDGDGSLRRRPMERVAAPLRAMGAMVETTAGCAPLVVRGGPLDAIDWTLPVASAQVKSAVLLAGLRARGTTRVREPLPSRDHTERLLAHLGAGVAHGAGVVEVAGGQRLTARPVPLPGDVSSAAFLVVAALLVPGSEIRLPEVGLNPTRTGALTILRRMGARIEVVEPHEAAGERRGELRVAAASLRGTDVAAGEVPAAIDELPILCVAAALAEGETTIAGAGELRVKESDRIAELVAGLRAMGADADERPDGFQVRCGTRLTGGTVHAKHDHRLAMAFAIAALGATGPTHIEGADAVAVSYPAFFEDLERLARR